MFLHAINRPAARLKSLAASYFFHYPGETVFRILASGRVHRKIFIPVFGVACQLSCRLEASGVAEVTPRWRSFVLILLEKVRPGRAENRVGPSQNF